MNCMKTTVSDSGKMSGVSVGHRQRLQQQPAPSRPFVLKQHGVYKFYRNLRVTSKFQASDRQHEASTVLKGPTVLQWPLNVTVIWRFLLGAWYWYTLLYVKKKAAIIMKYLALLYKTSSPGIRATLSTVPFLSPLSDFNIHFLIMRFWLLFYCWEMFILSLIT